MNIDSLTRLIEGADVAALRNVAVDLLPLLGFDETSFSDGPYDGGIDFEMRTQRVNGLRLGFQLSVERNWRTKIETDARKASQRHGINTLYFITSRRIPAGSWAAVRADLAKTLGVTVIKFDNQAIAGEFIRANKIPRLLSRFGIPIPDQQREFLLTPQHEAVAALLVFGSDARNFRDDMIDSTVKASLARDSTDIDRASLIQRVLAGLGLGESHGVLVNSSIDRLLQSGVLRSNQRRLTLEASELAKFKGLEEASRFELRALRETISSVLGSDQRFLESDRQLILENLAELTKSLVVTQFDFHRASAARDQVYSVIREMLAERLGSESAKETFAALAHAMAGSAFGRRVAASALYRELLATDSRSLVAALGGARGVSVFLDTSVFIPMICAVLFDPGIDRFGKSGADLLALMKAHEFTAILPAPYLEEVGSHLVSACRDYRALMDQEVDVTRSTNAFVSHFSSLKYHSGRSDLTFEEYLATFGIQLSKVPSVIEDDPFYRWRDRAAAEVRRIAQRYSIRVASCDVKFTKKAERRIEELARQSKLHRPQILISHDARVVSFIEEEAPQTDDVSVLCTWDRMHADLVADGSSSYFVMSPVSLIDFLSIAKREGVSERVATLDDFVDSVTEAQMVASARVWDAIARISGSELTDARLMGEARRFRETYLEGHASWGLISEEDIAKSWVAWRKAQPT